MFYNDTQLEFTLYVNAELDVETYPFHLRTVDFDKKIWSIHKHEGHEDDAHGPTHIHLADDRRLPYAEIDFDTVIDIAARSWRLSPPKPSHENPFWL